MIKSMHDYPGLRAITKAIAVFLAFTLVLPCMAWAFDARVYTMPRTGQVRVHHLGRAMVLPKKLGAINQSFQGNGKTIVHIQDLHCNHEVQKNIAGLIHYLAQEHNLRMVGEEGAFHTVHTSGIRNFPIEKIREQVSDYFVRQGKLTGAEYYAGLSEHAVRLEGIETPGLYNESRQAVGFFLNHESQGYCQDMRDILDEMKASIYNPLLRKFDSHRRDYREGKTNLLKYCAYLNSTAKGMKISREPYSQLVRFLNQRQNHFSLDMDSDQLFWELDGIDTEIRECLYNTATQRELDEHYRRLDIIEKILNISIAPRELQEFRAQRSEFRVSRFKTFINQHASQEKYILDTESLVLDEYIEKAERFYRQADERSGHFVDNLCRKMEKHGEDIAVMITGGFHTEKVLEELKRQNISYISIKPRLSRQDIVNPYFALLRNRQTPLEKLLAKNQDILALPTYLMDGRLATPARRIFARQLQAFLNMVNQAHKGQELIPLNIATSGQDEVTAVVSTRADPNAWQSVAIGSRWYHLFKSATRAKLALEKIHKQKSSIFARLGKTPGYFTQGKILTGAKIVLFTILSPIITVLTTGRIPDLALRFAKAPFGKSWLKGFAQWLSKPQPVDPKANISSGNWPEEWHEQLNDMIQRLIKSKEQNITPKYDQKELKKGLEETVSDLTSIIPGEIQTKIEASAQAINSSLTLDSLTDSIQQLLENPRLEFLFLEPDYGEDVFKFKVKKDGQSIVLNAQAHFGHNQTTGKDRQENVYLAAPYFNSVTQGEKLGLIGHELVHLILGKGNDVHELAEVIQASISYAYDSKAYNLESVRQESRDYINIKDDLLDALLREDREKALEKYNQWKELIKAIGQEDISQITSTNIIFRDLEEKLGPILAGIISNLGLAGKDVNARAKIMEAFLSQAEVGYSLGMLIFNTMNKLPLQKNPAPEDIVNALSKALYLVSDLLANEMRVISHPDIPDNIQHLINEVIKKEIVEPLYDDAPARRHWEKRLTKDVVPCSLENLVPEEYFKEGLFAEKRNYIMHAVSGLNKVSQAAAMQNSELNKVFLISKSNLKRTRRFLIHEFIGHHLGRIGQLKIDASWEFTAYAVDLCERIMWFRDGDIQAAEEEMEMLEEEYVPGLKELYLRGKEISHQGESIYILNPYQADIPAGYFSVDLITMEAIKIYESLGLPTDVLRRYLAHENKQLNTPFEQEQFHRDQYFAQKVSGMILAGIFMYEYEENQIHPVRSLRDYFTELDNEYGPPNEQDKLWLEQDLIPELEALAQQLFGARTTLKKTDAADRLGLWWAEADTDTWFADINYWPFTIYPKAKDDPNRAPYQVKAREKGIGNLLLSLYRSMHGQDKDLEEKHENWFGQPEFRILWDALLIPRAISMGAPMAQRKIKNDEDLGKYKEIPELIEQVFNEKYNLGNPKLEKELLNSSPRHLQFLDSLLYRWSQYTPEDPRVEPQSIVDLAVRRASSGWLEIMFRADNYSSYEEMFEAIREDIWPVYKELFDQDVEIEKNRKMIQEMEAEEKIKPGEFDPANLTPEQEEFLQDLFDSLPKDVQEQIIEAAREMMGSSSLGSGGKGRSEPGKAGEKPGQGSPADKGGQKPGIEDLPQTLENLESVVQSIGDMLDQVSQGAENIGEGAQEIGSSTPSAGEEMPEQARKMQDLSDQARELQDTSLELTQPGDQLEEAAGHIQEEALAAGDNLPIPEVAGGMQKGASEFNRDAGEVQDRIEELQKRVNELRQLIERLKESKTKNQDPTQVNQMSEAIKDKADKVRAACNEVGEDVGEAGDSLEGLEKEIKELSEVTKELADFGKDTVPHQADTGKNEGDESQPAQSTDSTEPGAADSSDKELEPLSLPAGDDVTSLKNIVKQAKEDRDSSPEDDPKDRYAGQEFTAKIDPAWQEAMEMDELLAEMARTGLVEEELREYKGWLGDLGEQQIVGMTDVLWGLMGPDAGTKKVWSQYIGIMKKPVKQVLGQAGMVRKKESMPIPLKLTLLIDVSGSMTGNRMLYAKLTMLMFLEAIFRINEELEKRGWPLIEFEIGCYNKDAELFISHETSTEIGEDRKERLIYDAVKALMATGSTDLKKGLGMFVTRLLESPEPRGSDKPARRMLATIGDGDVNTQDKEAIREVLASDEENNLTLFGVSVGDADARQSTCDAFGKARAILPQAEDLSDLPQRVHEKLSDHYELSWKNMLSGLMLPAWWIIMEAAVSAAEIFFRVSDQADQIPEPPLRPTGYRHFFYQEIAGRDYLVWQREDKQGTIHERRYQRGAGGPYVPQTVTIDDDENEALIREIFKKLHVPDVKYTSYSRDGQYQIRSGGNGEIQLMARAASDKWEIQREFAVLKEPPTGVEQAGFKIFEQNNLQWRRDALGNIYLCVSEDTWLPIIGQHGDFSEYLEIEYDEKQNAYLVFDSLSRRVVMAGKNPEADELEIKLDLAMEKFSRAEEWEGRIIRLIGEPSLGKDELIRAAAHLMNEELYLIHGNEDIEPVELRDYPTIGIEKDLETGHLYTALNRALHYGGWLVIDEWAKLISTVKGSLKTSTEEKTHQRWIKEDDGGETLKTLDNNPRARVIVTANEDRPGTEGSGVSDPAIQDRERDIPFIWRTPKSEKELHYKLMLRKLQALRPGLSGQEFDTEAKRIENIGNALVDIAWPMRLSFLGYDAAQQAVIAADDYKNWKKLLKDHTFMPNFNPGKNLRSAPSVRTIQQIIEYAVMFPKTWENIPWTISEFRFNLWAHNDLKPREQIQQMQSIKDQFEKPPTRGGSNGIKDRDDLLPLILIPDSFQLEGEWLVVTPQKVEQAGELIDAWDAIRIELHPEARENFIKHGLPENLKYWLSTGNQGNTMKLYLALQVQALGKGLDFVGPQGSGKSALLFGLLELLNGKDSPVMQIEADTDKEELLYQQGVSDAKTRFNLGPVAVAARDNKVVGLEELHQAKPGVLSVLHEPIERNIVSLADGTIIGEEGDSGFRVICTMNDFYGEVLDDAFLDRLFKLRFDMLSPEEMFEFLLPEAARNEISVNSRLIGEKRIDKNSEPVKLSSGEERWDGLLGVMQQLAMQKKENPLDKNLPPRIPGMRAFKDLIKEIRDTWEADLAFSDQSPQELLLEKFLSNFVMEGTNKQKAKWTTSIKKAFIEARLWSEAGGDALDDYLAGEEMIVQELPLLRVPDTKNIGIDRILIYLQKNSRGVSIAGQIDELGRKIDALKVDWDEMGFLERLKKMHAFRETWQILGLICKQRKGRGNDCHSDDNIEKMENVKQTVQAHVLDKDWPRTFIEPQAYIEKEDIETWEELLKKWGSLALTGILDIDDLLGKIAVNLGDKDYVDSQVNKLTSKKDEYLEKIQGRDENIHGNINAANTLIRISKSLGEISDNAKTGKPEGDSKNIQELRETIDAGLTQSGWPLSGREYKDEAVAWQNYLRILQASAELKDNKEIEEARKNAEAIFEQAQAAEEKRVLDKYGSDIYQAKLFEILWGIQTARAPAPIQERLEQLREEIKGLMDKGDWETLDRDVLLIRTRQLLWIRAGLILIAASYKKENAYEYKKCAASLEAFANEIDQHLAKYNWPQGRKGSKDKESELIKGLVIPYSGESAETGEIRGRISELEKEIEALQSSGGFQIKRVEAKDIRGVWQKINSWWGCPEGLDVVTMKEEESDGSEKIMNCWRHEEQEALVVVKPSVRDEEPGNPYEIFNLYSSDDNKIIYMIIDDKGEAEGKRISGRYEKEEGKIFCVLSKTEMERLVEEYAKVKAILADSPEEISKIIEYAESMINESEVVIDHKYEIEILEKLKNLGDLWKAIPFSGAHGNAIKPGDLLQDSVNGEADIIIEIEAGDFGVRWKTWRLGENACNLLLSSHGFRKKYKLLPLNKLRTLADLGKLEIMDGDEEIINKIEKKEKTLKKLEVKLSEIENRAAMAGLEIKERIAQIDEQIQKLESAKPTDGDAETWDEKRERIIAKLPGMGFKKTEEKAGGFEVWEARNNSKNYFTIRPEAIEISIHDLEKRRVRFQETRSGSTILHVQEPPGEETRRSRIGDKHYLVDIHNDIENKKIIVVVKDEFMEIFETINSNPLFQFADGQTCEFIGQTEMQERKRSFKVRTQADIDSDIAALQAEKQTLAEQIEAQGAQKINDIVTRIMGLKGKPKGRKLTEDEIKDRLEQWDINAIADANVRNIIRLGAAIMLKTQVPGGFPEEAKAEWDELRGYLNYASPNIANINVSHAKNVWEIRAAALGMYYGIGGKINNQEMRFIVSNIAWKEEPETDVFLSMLRDYFPVAFAIYMDMLKNDEEVRDQSTDIPGELGKIIDNAQRSIKNNITDEYSTKEVFRALAQMHNLTGPEDRKEISRYMYDIFNGSEDSNGQMAILEAWDEMWDSMDEENRKDIVELTKKFRMKWFDLQVVIRLFNLVNQRKKYEGLINDKNIKEVIKSLTDKNLDDKNFKDKNPDDKNLIIFDIISHMELAGGNAEIIQNSGEYNQIMEYLLGCMDARDVKFSWELRLAAVKAMVEIVKPEDNKEIITKLWEKLDDDHTNTIYYWALWGLGEDRGKIKEEIEKPRDYQSEGEKKLKLVIENLCVVSEAQGVQKQLLITSSICGGDIYEDYLNQIRPEILDYLAEEIVKGEMDARGREEIFESIRIQIERGRLGFDGAEMLKKIYENEVDDKKKKDIEKNIFKIDPKRFRLAALPGSKILPIHYPMLENDTTRMEYSARLIEAMKHAIYGEIKEIGPGEGVLGMSRRELENMVTYNPAGLIKFLDKAKTGQTGEEQIEAQGASVIESIVQRIMGLKAKPKGRELTEKEIKNQLEQWGINNIADENIQKIVGLGAAIVLKTQASGKIPKEAEEDLKKLRVYLDFGSSDGENLSNQDKESKWKIRGAALGMYYGIGGKIDAQELMESMVSIAGARWETTDYLSMLRDYFPVVFAIYMDMLTNDENIEVELTNNPEELAVIIANAEKSIENDNSSNKYVTKEVLRALAQMHNLTEPKYKEKINIYMIDFFKQAESGIQMQILDAWDEMWESMDEKRREDIVGLPDTLPLSNDYLQVSIRLLNLVNKRNKYMGLKKAENIKEFINKLTDEDLMMFNRISHMELAGDNAGIIQNSEEYNQVVEYLLECVAELKLDLDLRLAAVKAMKKIVEPGDEKAIIKKIWKKLESDTANSTYYFALWELGDDRGRMEEELVKIIEQKTDHETEEDSNLKTIIRLMCVASEMKGEVKYIAIRNLIGAANIYCDYLKRIRPEILDYLAEEIIKDEMDAKERKEIIESIRDQINGFYLGLDGAEMLKKIYENEVDDEKKAYIKKVISGISSEGLRLAALPDSEILPIHHPGLEKYTTHLEYSARLIEAMKQAIYGEIKDIGPGEKVQQELENIKQMLKALPLARQVMAQVNYGKLWREYAQAVKQDEKEKENAQYWQLIQGIRAADTLETAQELQNMYLYLLQRKKVEDADLESAPEILPEKYKITEITREIREQLAHMQSRMEAALDVAINKTDDSEEKAWLSNIKKKLLSQEFIAPLKSALAKKRIGFRFSRAEKIKLEAVLKSESGKAYRVVPALSEEIPALGTSGEKAWSDEFTWDKEGLAEYIQELAKEYRKIENKEGYWQERIAIIESLSGLTQLEGVEVEGKEAYEYIKKIIPIKQTDEMSSIEYAKMIGMRFKFVVKNSEDEDEAEKRFDKIKRYIKHFADDTELEILLEEILKSEKYEQVEKKLLDRSPPGDYSESLKEVLKHEIDNYSEAASAKWKCALEGYGRLYFQADKDETQNEELEEFIEELLEKHEDRKAEVAEFLANLKHVNRLIINQENGDNYIKKYIQKICIQKINAEDAENTMKSKMAYAKYIFNNRESAIPKEIADYFKYLEEKYREFAKDGKTGEAIKMIAWLSKIENLSEAEKAGIAFYDKESLMKEIQDEKNDEIKGALLKAYARMFFMQKNIEVKPEETLGFYTQLIERCEKLDFSENKSEYLAIYKIISGLRYDKVKIEGSEGYGFVLKFLKELADKWEKGMKDYGSEDKAKLETAQVHYTHVLEAYWKLKLESYKQRPESEKNMNLENKGVFGVAIIGILPWLQEPTVSGLYLSGAILALLAYWGVNLIMPTIKSRISKSVLSRAERGIKASDKFMEIIPSEIKYPPNANILKNRLWLFEHWPQLHLAIIGIMAAWPGRARQPNDPAKGVKHDLGQRVLGSLAPNELALLDILKAKSIEIRRLPENIGWGKYLIGLVGQKWMERNGAQIIISLPAQLCDEYVHSAGQADTLTGRLVSQIMAYMGELHYSGIYKNIHKAEGLLETVKSDPLLAQQFNLQTPDGRSLQNALEQLARGQTPETVQRLSWVVLRALTKAESQPLEKSLLSMLEKVDPWNSIKVEVLSESGKEYQMSLPAVIFEKKSLYWLLNQKYPGGIRIIEKRKFRLPEIELRKYISQAA